MKMKVLILCSDYDACWHFRVDLPFRELEKYGVEHTQYCFIPTAGQFWELIEVIKNFDLVIVQRCYILSSVKVVKAACEFLGVPLIFETDDDYLNLHPSNPAYFAVADDQSLYRQYKEAQTEQERQNILPALEESRQKGLEDYKTILRMSDYITVTNDVLARTIYPYNKNVTVFQNNIDRLFPWRDSVDLKSLLSDNGVRFEIPNVMGFFIVPDHTTVDCKLGKVNNFDVRGVERRNYVRIGYSTSPSRKGADWLTVKDALNTWSTKTRVNHLIVTIENHAERLDDGTVGPYFYNSIENKENAVAIPITPYDKYMQNYRNMDIALAPLEPTPFNTSRSEIKLLEASAWKIPGLVPRLITYSRGFKEEENCLMYSNEHEFIEQLERLASSPSLRKKLGEAAYEYVASERLEKYHTQRRYEFYKKAIEEKKRMVCIK